MDQQSAQRIAQKALSALSDNRVMVPADASEALADLKSILRNLMTGTMVIIEPNQKAPVSEGEGEGEGE